MVLHFHALDWPIVWSMILCRKPRPSHNQIIAQHQITHKTVAKDPKILLTNYGSGENHRVCWTIACAGVRRADNLRQ